MAKFLVTWQFRRGGSGSEVHQDTKDMLDQFVNWQPPADETFHQFLVRVDGKGGAAVVETDNVAGFGQATALFGPWVDYDIEPVVDVTEGLALMQEGINRRGK